MHRLYTVRCTLKSVRPAVWRRLELPGSFDIDDLPWALLIAMGWEEEHGYELSVPECLQLEDEQEKTLDVLFDELPTSFSLRYGPELEWGHNIVVEAVQELERPGAPRCIGGERACPPDDCGGPEGYTRLLEALKRDKASFPFSPERFDLDEATRRIEIAGGGLWLCGMLQPFDDEDHQLPGVVIWADPLTDELIGQAATDPSEWRDAAVELFQDALEQVDLGHLEPLQRIRVDDEELARRLEQLVADKDILVSVGPTPELDTIADLLLSEMGQLAGGDIAATDLLTHEELPDDRLARFFTAAARLFRAEPWAKLAAGEICKMSAPELGLPEAVLITEGSSARDFDLAILESLDDCREFLQASATHAHSAVPPNPSVVVRSFNYERGAALPRDLRKKIATKGWEVASAQAYPNPLCLAPSGLLQPIDERAIAVFTAAAEALAQLVESHGAALLDEPSLHQSFDIQDLPEISRVTLTSGIQLELDHHHEEMTAYDPTEGPSSPHQWLSLDEDERFDLVAQAHDPAPKNHPKLANVMLHTSFHVIVENQLALDQPRHLRAALANLTEAGLDREQAIHAIAGAAAHNIHRSNEEEGPFSGSGYSKDLASLLDNPQRFHLPGTDETSPKKNKSKKRKSKNRRNTKRGRK